MGLNSYGRKQHSSLLSSNQDKSIINKIYILTTNNSTNKLLNVVFLFIEIFIEKGGIIIVFSTYPRKIKNIGRCC